MLKCSIREKLETIFKIVYIIHLLLAFNGFINQTVIIKITLVLTLLLGGAVGLQKIWSFMKLKQKTNFWILNLFIISYVLSLLMGMKYGLVDGIKGLVWLTAEVWILYLVDNKGNIKKEFELISKVIIVFVSIANIASVGMFLLGIVVKNIVEDKMYVLGFVWGRLWGIYNDPNHGAVISVLTLLLSLYFVLTLHTNKKRYWLSIIIQGIYIYLSDSRTGILCLGIGIGLVCAMNFMKKHLFELNVKKILVTIGIFIIFFGVAILLETPVQKGMGTLANATTHAISYDKNKDDEIGEVIEEEIVVGREEEESSDPSNRRFDIWKSGVEIFMTKPITGVGWTNIIPYAQDVLPDTYMVNNDLQNFASCHNMPIDVLVGQGLIGILLLILLVIKSFVEIVKYVLNNKKEVDLLVIIMFSILVVSAFSSLLISSIFYINSPESYIFWLVFGYLMCIVSGEKKRGI